MTLFSAALDHAIGTALEAHQGQVRRGTNVPYASHPVHIAMMLTRLGVDEVTVTAALLHDVVEDCDGWDFDRIEAEFGSDVRRLVADLTEDKEGTWKERKSAGVAKAHVMDSRSATVKAADKLHNLSTLVRDLQATDDPGALWGRFKGGPEGTLTMATQLVEALVPRVDKRLGQALQATLDQLRSMVAQA
ncbi:MAG: HD domain-containing protein [Planctomycetota bacterium]